MSIKALAVAVLQGNHRGNQGETKSFLPGKLRKPEPTPRKPNGSLPDWRHNLCIAHAEFNKWRGFCPCSIDDCLVSRVIDSDGDIDKLRGRLELGNGTTTDMVIDAWRESGEPIADLLNNPAWMICIAEYLFTEKEAANEEK